MHAGKPIEIAKKMLISKDPEK